MKMIYRILAGAAVFASGLITMYGLLHSEAGLIPKGPVYLLVSLFVVFYVEKLGRHDFSKVMLCVVTIALMISDFTNLL